MRHQKVVVLGPGAVEVIDWPAAAQLRPGAGELLVQPDRVGICGTDLEIAEGTLVYIRQGLAHLPITPGHEWTGVIVATGDDAGAFRPGDRVVGEPHLNCGHCPTCLVGPVTLCPNRREVGVMNFDGAMASRMLFPASHAHKVSPAVDALDAVLVEPLAVVLRALDRLGPGPGSPVLVVGCGTIGCLAVSVCAHYRITVNALDTRRERLLAAVACGAAIAGPGDLYPFVVEATGTADGLLAACAHLDAGGKLLVLGLTGQDRTLVPLDDLVVRDQTLVGSLGSAGYWDQAIRLVESGTIRPRALVTDIFPLAQAPEALRLLKNSRPTVGKVVLAID